MLLINALALVATFLHAQSAPTTAPAVDIPIRIRPAPEMTMPGAHGPDDKTGYVDCNSPAHWDGRTMYMFYSAGHPYRSSGPGLAGLERDSVKTHYDNTVNGGRWIEATHKDAGGKLYGWYHNEPHPNCGKQEWTSPLIGAVVSEDNGLHWRDLGVVLSTPAGSDNCDSVNFYFTGGNGDFCVVPDRSAEYLYILTSTYNRNVAEQGLAIARMRCADRDAPVGKVQKWRDGKWSEPGIAGRITLFIPVITDWHRADVDAFWGPSVHWNTHLRKYVMLLNRAVDKNWKQEGIYVSFNADIADPVGWSKPVKILDAKDLPGSKWYPQVIGLDAAARETDKLAGRRARLFVAGTSRWELEFQRAGQ